MAELTNVGKIRRILPFSCEQMFNLVADIEAYADFVPFCNAAFVHGRNPCNDGEIVEAELKFRIPGLSTLSLPSLVSLANDKSSIEIVNPSGAGPIHRMTSRWDFAKCNPHCSEVQYQFEVEMRFKLAEKLVARAVNERKIVEAFAQRANEVYGPEWQ